MHNDVAAVLGFLTLIATAAVLVFCHFALPEYIAVDPTGNVFMAFPAAAAARGLGFLRYPTSAVVLGILPLLPLLLF